MTGSPTTLWVDAMMNQVIDRVPPDVTAWVKRSWEAAASGDYEAIAPAFAAASRRLRGIEISPDGDGRPGVGGEPPLALRPLPADALFRSALFLAACAALPDERQARLADRLYSTGDSAERSAVLRVLARAPAPERMVEIAVEACRSNVIDVFEAIACENPFPARWFPDPPFNQMVMKAVFSGIALERVVGLEGRRNGELRRMALDFSAERRAAGRSVPADLKLIAEERCEP